MLRQSLHRRRKEGGRVYQPVAKEAQDPAKNSAARDPIVDFNKDPSYFCHYLEFVGATDVAPPTIFQEQDGDGCCSEPGPSGPRWKNRAVEMLGEDHPAQRLLRPCSAEDTERSMMMQTPRSSTGLLAFMETSWEGLT